MSTTTILWLIHVRFNSFWTTMGLWASEEQYVSTRKCLKLFFTFCYLFVSTVRKIQNITALKMLGLANLSVLTIGIKV